jgi:uncharacterized protein (UPF0335 family)
MNDETENVADSPDLQPDEINALKDTVKEFMNRLESIDNEIETLKTDRKELIEEYKDKLDMKTLQACLRIIKIQRGVEHRDSFDAFMEVLQDPAS